MTAATAADPSAGFGTSRYRTYVLSALTLIYILNFVDRGLLAVVGPELVPELGLSDTQFGLLPASGLPCSTRSWEFPSLGTLTRTPRMAYEYLRCYGLR